MVCASWTVTGTIGGGEIERCVIRDAQACLTSRTPLLKT
ncbi:MAG: XdhC family protein, partial [Clostridia bacterium]|nr:XdhC family protein [Clostridia bacterium]